MTLRKHSLSLSLLSLLFLSSTILSYSFETHIDCGALSDSTDEFNQEWKSDRFLTSGGSTSIVSEPFRFKRIQERTIRYFPVDSSGKKNCYVIPVPPGRYYIRTFTVYDNYDMESHEPSFDMSIEGTLVFSWRSPWPRWIGPGGAYNDFIVDVDDGEADICFYSIDDDSPVISSLDLVQIDRSSYRDPSYGDKFALVCNGRLSASSSWLGMGFSNNSDLLGRYWQPDIDFRAMQCAYAKQTTAIKDVVGANRSPNYFPQQLYQTALNVSILGSLFYEWPIDAKMDYLLWFHFAEIDARVTGPGQRVFDIFINGANVKRVDIYEEVGGFAAYSWSYVATHLSSGRGYLRVWLSPVVGSPLICGLEIYTIILDALYTVPSEEWVGMETLVLLQTGMLGKV